MFPPSVWSVMSKQSWAIQVLDTVLILNWVPGNEREANLVYCWQGFGVTWYRTMGLLCTYFILLDSGRRKFPDLFRRPILGPFLASGIAATYPSDFANKIGFVIFIIIVRVRLNRLVCRWQKYPWQSRGFSFFKFSQYVCLNISLFCVVGCLAFGKHEVASSRKLWQVCMSQCDLSFISCSWVNSKRAKREKWNRAILLLVIPSDKEFFRAQLLIKFEAQWWFWCADDKLLVKWV